MKIWFQLRNVLTDTSKTQSELSALKLKLCQNIGISRRTLNGWLSDSKSDDWPGTSQSYEDQFRDFLFSTSNEGNAYTRLAAALVDLLETKQKKIDYSEYIGKYRSMRLGNEDRFIEGDVLIEASTDGDYFHHYHETEQFFYANDGSTRIETFTHEGPVIFIGNRLYFLACGIADGKRYMRPMIFVGNDLPHHNVLYGIVLTETPARFQPLSSAVALVSYDHPDMRSEELLDDLESTLKLAIQSDRVLKGILVG